MVPLEPELKEPNWSISFQTVLGPALLTGRGEVVLSFGWVEKVEGGTGLIGTPGTHLPSLIEALHACLSGNASGWAHIRKAPVRLIGTPFQTAVWNALREIPYGVTRTYGKLAEQLGRTPASARAVGAACALNPAALFVPCHRVLAASGALTGFKWGLERKRILLASEQTIQNVLFP